VTTQDVEDGSEQTTNKVPVAAPDEDVVNTFEKLTQGDDPDALRYYLKQLTMNGSNDDALELSFELPRLTEEMSPEMLKIVGQHFLDEGEVFDGNKLFGGALGEDYQRSRLLGATLSEELTLQDRAPNGDLLENVLSVNDEDWMKNHAGIQKYMDDNGVYTDQTLPSNVYTKLGNDLRYMNKLNHLFQGEDGVRLFRVDPKTGAPLRNPDGSLVPSDSAGELNVSAGVKVVGNGGDAITSKPSSVPSSPVQDSDFIRIGQEILHLEEFIDRLRGKQQAAP
jgi:hypothetical protein